MIGAIPIERSRVSRRSADLAADLIAQGWSLLLYPEGGRSPDGWGRPLPWRRRVSRSPVATARGADPYRGHRSDFWQGRIAAEAIDYLGDFRQADAARQRGEHQSFRRSYRS